MARTKSEGNGRLEEAMALLIQNQASFVAQMAETNRQIAEIQRQIAETDRINAERFRRIEAILLEHTRILQALPEAVRDKIGFKAPPPPA
ncbi:MAG TPA: hypothetical protein VMF69_07325 [Gemmataceae bacterium]|nr:hypothetical protein [Gemmataceae bacterium]